jgi:hypothetical protein
MTDTKLTPEAEAEARRFFSAIGSDTQFKPGKSGNPTGRPPAPDTDDLIEILKWRLGRSGARKIADKLIALALDERGGAVTMDAIKYIYDRIEGKPRQTAVTVSDDESPIVRILRGLVDPKPALEGRQLTAGRPAPTFDQLDTVDATDVREVASQ